MLFYKLMPKLLKESLSKNNNRTLICGGDDDVIYNIMENLYRFSKEYSFDKTIVLTTFRFLWMDNIPSSEQYDLSECIHTLKEICQKYNESPNRDEKTIVFIGDLDIVRYDDEEKFHELINIIKNSEHLPIHFVIGSYHVRRSCLPPKVTQLFDTIYFSGGCFDSEYSLFAEDRCEIGLVTKEHTYASMYWDEKYWKDTKFTISVGDTFILSGRKFQRNENIEMIEI